MGEHVNPKIRQDVLGHPGGQVAVSHRQHALGDDQSQEQPDRIRHAPEVVLDGDDVPQKTRQPHE
jgi:hypothetical protein